MLETSICDRIESNVRYYSREYPVIFSRGEGSFVIDDQGRAFIDFFGGAGALNYGHNHPLLKGALIEYLRDDGIVHSLDLNTEAKLRFLECFERVILQPRHLEYKVQFTGPTGTNAVEAALKLARLVTGRSLIAAFTGGFHGVSLGALAATALRSNRTVAGVQLDQVVRLPYEGFLGGGEIDYIEKMLTSDESGISPPAAFLLETVQGEGGLKTLSAMFVMSIFALARRIGALVIVDDVQAGCGRTGRFFSFEHFSVTPDMVCLSKSISGLGLPMALLLMKGEHDRWKPGEHNGTFRGNNLAFITAAAALGFWESSSFGEALAANIDHLESRLDKMCERFAFSGIERMGRGMFAGIDVHDGKLARQIKQDAFRLGVLLETCGATGSVLKIMAPLNIEQKTLDKGLDILEAAFSGVLSEAACAAGA
jgi:diaminobutyrate-2-oxoglutarate transaminase